MPSPRRSIASLGWDMCMQPRRECVPPLSGTQHALSEGDMNQLEDGQLLAPIRRGYATFERDLRQYSRSLLYRSYDSRQLRQ